MKELCSILDSVPEFNNLLTAIENGECPAVLTGLSAVHQAHFAAGLYLKTGRPIVMVCEDEADAVSMASDLRAFTEHEVQMLSSRDFAFYDSAAISRQWEHRRLAVMDAMLTGKATLIVVTIEALLQRTIPPNKLASVRFSIEDTGTYNLEDLINRLVDAGYTRCRQVEGTGQFTVRGGILDFFSPAYDQPARIEFWGDQVDSMGLFDVTTQRRTEMLDQVYILPASEVLPSLNPELDWLGGDRYLGKIYPEMATATDYLPLDAVVCLCESPRLVERAKNYLSQLKEDLKYLVDQGEIHGDEATFALNFNKFATQLENWPVCIMDTFARSEYPLQPRKIWQVDVKQIPSFGVSFETAEEDLHLYATDESATVILVSGEKRAVKMQEMLRDNGYLPAIDFSLKILPEPGQVFIALGGLSAGMSYGATCLVVLTEGFASIAKKRKKKNTSNRQRIQSYADLKPGDLVVHEHHGIGCFVGMTKIIVDGVEKEYVQLAYAGTDMLYVPTTQLDLVSKYIGTGDQDGRRRLSSLGGTEWAKTRSRAKKAVEDLAKGLIQLYAERQRQPGFAFSPDSPWMREFEDSFEYPETDDQLRCIEEIKHDMEQAKPMDRLLCGDVGFGKTEVAFRAVMKCVLDGKQAAILVPTTVLARQHFLTAQKRFEKFPVEIEMLSRFASPVQVRDILQRLREGKIDLLIGTHRLLQKDVVFKDLGLLVVDEEQRFGVSHKERLKEISKQVDVLTLSATPIPRTLNMALSGLRDMSTLEEPPLGRQPVQTYVVEHDWAILCDAMRRELKRGGQVYYLHNRVENIEQVAYRIQKMLGDQVVVGIAHGKMKQKELDNIMTRMTENKLDVLVCTTIIETGIDLGNVNTLIIENADRMGLAQLHQIRGRVGRSGRRAYAYMTYRSGKVLSETAMKRLAAIQEFAEFGAGFKIAMRDLEIRGAGNLLGAEQSGFMVSVGYDMYLKLLEEAVLEEKGESLEIQGECIADLNVTASIPDNYVPAQEQRMDLYRRIAHLRTEEEADDVTDELVDRFGDPPRTVNNLISIALLRSKAAACGISEITQKGKEIRFELNEMNLERISALSGEIRYKNRILLVGSDKPCLVLKLVDGEDPLRLCQRLVSDYMGPLSGKDRRVV